MQDPAYRFSHRPHTSYLEQVVDVGAGVVGAGLAAAGGVNGALVVSEPDFWRAEAKGYG
jgi:hypothetical protein